MGLQSVTPAGYSGTPLVRKLGIKAGMACAVIDPPADYLDLLVGVPDDVEFGDGSSHGLEFVHVFARNHEGLADCLARLRGTIAQNGMIWVSWPKKSSGVVTDLSGHVVRQTGLAAGLVDVKVCAVDETWSGLKFVIPKAHRSGSVDRRGSAREGR